MQATVTTLGLSLEKEYDIIQKSVERQDLLKHSMDNIPIQLSALSEQIEELELSIKKLSELERVIHRRSDRLEKCLIHCMPRAELSFEVALAEHCDLNCAGCDHFSPLAEPEFADFEETERAFARLSLLFHGHAKEIHLLGREPLLHPDLVKFFKMARENFPDAVIDVTTNGLQLLNQPEEFWVACRENNIVIRPTKYPIPLDFEEMEKRAAAYGVEYRYIGSSGTVIKTTKTTKLYSTNSTTLQ